jgi:hypothetical protein
MQYRPDLEALMVAVAEFIDHDLKAALSDQALAFRARIAANVLRVGALELRTEDWADDAELESLASVLGEAPTVPAGRGGRRARIAELDAALSARLLSDEPLPPETLARIEAHVHDTLRQRIQIANPRFDLDWGR